MDAGSVVRGSEGLCGGVIAAESGQVAAHGVARLRGDFRGIIPWAKVFVLTFPARAKSDEVCVSGLGVFVQVKGVQIGGLKLQCGGREIRAAEDLIPARGVIVEPITFVKTSALSFYDAGAKDVERPLFQDWVSQQPLLQVPLIARYYL